LAGGVEAQTDIVDGLTADSVTPTLVRAAGGVVWRAAGRNGVEVLLVHRPRYGDWSLPKGKLKRGEHPIVGACREVHEETAVDASVTARLPTVSYTTHVGAQPAPKVVDYWAMTVVAESGFTPGAEIDAIGWLAVDRALGRLSYDHDVSVLTAFAELPALAAPVVLMRHASAGDRQAWTGPDSERPLDPDGVVRARDLARILRCFHPTRLVSATPVRCRQTMVPLAESTGRTVEVDEVFDESADPDLAAQALRRLGEGPGCTVVCSQKVVIPGALAGLTGTRSEAYATPKGAGWVLSFAGGHLAALDQLT
jgi:8-oxo-dGTP pyrophosphatase MutT (NUDIX family)/phosphohistidine phosphatase SixA